MGKKKAKWTLKIQREDLRTIVANYSSIESYAESYFQRFINGHVARGKELRELLCCLMANLESQQEHVDSVLELYEGLEFDRKGLADVFGRLFNKHLNPPTYLRALPRNSATVRDLVYRLPMGWAQRRCPGKFVK